MGRLAGKVAFLTGASLGIGRAAALRFAAEGARLTICARRPEALAETAAEIRRQGGDITTLTLDVSDLEAYKRALHETAAHHGRLDVLVNNAMDASMGMIEGLALEDWHRAFRVNVDPAFVSTQEAFRLMRGTGGSIINTVSICATRAIAGSAAYSATKAALKQFSAIAAMEGARHNIRVNTIAPGVLDTPGLRADIGNSQEATDATAATIPMKRLGRPEDGANLMLFLASDESAYITGACIPVDGGLSAQLTPPPEATGTRDQA